MPRLCAISVDLDPIGCYYAIHGVTADGSRRGSPEPPAALADVVLRRAVPRFAELFRQRGLRATFFCVGKDLETELGRAMLGSLAGDGHELGNHSYSHHYDLARRTPAEIDAEVGLAHDLIARAAGRPPVGFRAPGYDVSPAMLEAIAARGYRYDSSIFASPPYYLAKLLVLAKMAVSGRRSASVMTDPRALLAPTDPYRPHARAPWRPGQASVVELPIAVTPVLRIPAIGTSMALMPAWARARLLERMRRRPFFNFELHGLDLLDAEEDGIPAELCARQPDLRRPLAERRRMLCATLDRLAAEYRFVPLAEAAALAQREGRIEMAA